MKISEIEYTDWRCFLGVQKLVFSTDKNKPLTTIWGSNGGGKTTSINAILWVLWNEFTPDFSLPDQLVNDLKLQNTPVDEIVECKVELKFEHGKSKYVVARTYSQKKSPAGKSPKAGDSTVLTEINEAGESFIRRDSIAFAHVNEMLPKALAKYFFISGEHAKDHLGSTLGKKEIGLAVQRVLGLTKYERAIKHCDEAARKLLAEVGQLEDDAKFNDLVDEKEQLEKDLDADLDLNQTQKDQLDKCLEKINQIDGELIKYAHISDKIKRRSAIANEISAHERTAELRRSNLPSLISKNYALFVLKDQVEVVFALSEQHRRQKHIPAGFKQTFITDLLSSGKCICGCSLLEGEDNYLQVAARLNEGGVSGTEEQWALLGNGISKVTNRLDTFVQEFKETLGVLHDENKAITKLSEEAETLTREIHSEGGDGDVGARILALESDRKLLLSKNIEFGKRIGEYEYKIGAAREKIKKLEKLIATTTPKNDAAKLARKRRAYLLEAGTQLEKSLKDLREEKRIELQEKSTSIFRSMSNIDSLIELDDNFIMRMCVYTADADLREIVLGTGDSLMMYYAFVSALSKMSLDIAGSGGGKEGFPMMFDAPLNVIDGVQRRRVVEILPDLTHQLVFIMLEEGNTGPMEIVADKIGRVAIMEYLLSKGNSAIATSEIKLPQGIFPYVSLGKDELHSTKIVQVL